MIHLFAWIVNHKRVRNTFGQNAHVARIFGPAVRFRKQNATERPHQFQTLDKNLWWKNLSLNSLPKGKILHLHMSIVADVEIHIRPNSFWHSLQTTPLDSEIPAISVLRNTSLCRPKLNKQSNALSNPRGFVTNIDKSDFCKLDLNASGCKL